MDEVFYYSKQITVFEIRLKGENFFLFFSFSLRGG